MRRSSLTQVLARQKHRPRLLPLLLVLALLMGSLQITAASPSSEVGASTASSTTQQEGANSATAQDLALAMGVPADDIVSASLMGSDPRGVAVGNTDLGTAGFPTEGATFAILSTGVAGNASQPNNDAGLSATLEGLNNSTGNDLVRFHLELKVPDAINCVAFDFVYYSEEFPEYVGQNFNDTFTAQLNESDLLISTDSTVSAPGNFAFDTEGNIISVNAAFGMQADTGTTYDGGTPLLRAETPVVPGSTIDLYFSIQDLGDSVYDSAVFLDNFAWSEAANCEEGAQIAEPEPAPTIYYVDVDAVGSATGSSWANAFLTLQDALQVAVAGDQIWVAQGVYYPDMGNGQTDNDRSASFNISADVALYGGFDPGAGVETMDARDWGVYVTVLSGDIDQDDIADADGIVSSTTDIRGANSYHVVYLDGTSETGTAIAGTTIIDGFVITAGLADGEGYPNGAGGALFCNGFAADGECSPTVKNVVFSGNRSGGNGGAVFNDGRNSGSSNPSYTNVIFSGNSALFGGALYNYGGSGGESSPALTNVTFSGNLAEVWGGAVLNQGENGGNASPTFANVTFSGNAAQAGAAIYNYGDGGTSSPILTNVILWGNSAASGASVYARNADVAVRYSIVENGADSIGSEGAAAIAYAFTNSESDPLFAQAVSSADAPTSSGDLQLQVGSSAIDAGDDSALPTGVATDLAGNPRIVNGSVDIGAYEFVASPVIWTLQAIFDEEEVGTVAWSPQGDLVALGMTSGVVLVWSVEENEVVATFESHSSSVTSITWSPDGIRLASTSTNGANADVRIWNLESGESEAGFGGNYGGILSIDWSSDGRFLACGLGNGSVLVYDAQAFKEVTTLKAQAGSVNSVVWSPDNSQLAAGTEDGSVVIWSTGTWETVTSVASGEGSILSISWSPDGSMLVCGFASGLVVVSDVVTMEAVTSFNGQTGSVYSVAWSPDGNSVAVGTAEGFVQVWSVQTWSIAATLEAQAGSVTSISWSQSSGWFAVGTGGVAQVWAKEFAQPEERWRPGQSFQEDDSVISAAVSPNGNLVASGLANGTVVVRQVTTQEIVIILEGLSGRVNSVTWSPDGNRLAGGSEGGFVLVWSVRSWQVITAFEGDAGDVLSVTWSPDGGMIVCAFSSGIIVVGDATTGETMTILEGPADRVTSVVWLGNRLVGGSSDGSAWVWDVTTWEEVTVFSGETGVLRVTLSPDGTMIICGLADGTVVIGDVATGEVIGSLEVGSGGISGVAWIGNRAIAVDDEGVLVVWDVITWEEVTRTQVIIGSVTDVTTSYDGTQLTISTSEGTVQLVDTVVMNIRGAPAAVISDTGRYYRLQTMFLENENKCLEGNQLASDAILGGAAFMDDCQNVTGQMWKFMHAGGGYYRLQTMFLEGENRCLEGNRLAPGSVLSGGAFMDACQDVTGQFWKLVDAGGGYFRLQTMFLEGENRCLEGNRLAPESVLQGAAFMDACQNVTGQLWKLVPTNQVLPEEEEAHHGVHWTYEGDEGTKAWGALGYHTCEAGTHQSPISITTTQPEDLTNILVNYRPSSLTVRNTGHTVQADYAPGSFITVDGETYMLDQFHYHAPSEHEVDGRSFPAELHLVHTNGKRKAVIGVLLEEGDEENPAYKPFIDNLPAQESPETDIGAEIDAAALLPSVQTTYRYSGSLTTPPCTEGVTWLVMTEPVSLSGDQRKKLEAVFEGNNRPVQPLNDRSVKKDTTP